MHPQAVPPLWLIFIQLLNDLRADVTAGVGWGDGEMLPSPHTPPPPRRFILYLPTPEPPEVLQPLQGAERQRCLPESWIHRAAAFSHINTKSLKSQNPLGGAVSEGRGSHPS